MQNAIYLSATVISALLPTAISTQPRSNQQQLLQRWSLKKLESLKNLRTLHTHIFVKREFKYIFIQSINQQDEWIRSSLYITHTQTAHGNKFSKKNMYIIGQNSQKTFDFLLPDTRQKYPTFWVPEPDISKFLPDLTRIRLFTTRTIRYPTFCYPFHHQTLQ